jgi:hypothetical protein
MNVRQNTIEASNSVATRRINDPIEPMDLANMRANGVRSLLIFCRN